MSAMPEYVLGHDDPEMERLKLQAQVIAEVSRRLIRKCGIEPGMQVLEIGCGVGDLSMLLAEAVGSSGKIVAFDREQRPVEMARQRARAAGHEQIEFLVMPDDDLLGDSLFDAAVGRYVLVHQPDPAAMVRRAAAAVRPAGIVAFHELALAIGGRSCPTVPLFDQALRCNKAVFQALLPHYDVGERLIACFEDAGLPAPSLIWESIAGGSTSPVLPWLAATYRSLLPHMERLGIPNGDVGEPDTLLQRLVTEVAGVRGQVVSVPQSCAWAIRP